MAQRSEDSELKLLRKPALLITESKADFERQDIAGSDDSRGLAHN